MSFISDQLAKHLNNRYREIGTVENLDLGYDSVRATVRLNGDSDSSEIAFSGICWSAQDGVFRLHYAEATASKPWLQGLLNILAEKNGKQFNLPDKMSLMPVKMMFPKNGGTD
ncbi:MAG: hypothetical protein LBT53_01130 [Puniceicoccales bacterium]|jgi:hypothetical protein|nr:hypothetical protein [Puniceicoccales bacterium]